VLATGSGVGGWAVSHCGKSVSVVTRSPPPLALVASLSLPGGGVAPLRSSTRRLGCSLGGGIVLRSQQRLLEGHCCLVSDGLDPFDGGCKTESCLEGGGGGG
jgi:hypothetical protein